MDCLLLFSNSKASELIHLISLDTIVILLCLYNVCATAVFQLPCLCLRHVIATDVENAWLVHFKISPGFQSLIRIDQIPFNMKTCRAI